MPTGYMSRSNIQSMASSQPRGRCFRFALVLVVAAMYMQRHIVYGEPQVPCYFILGDSLVDSGNNNNLPTSAKVNYPPYGIDFPGGRPTGRFCNGRTAADIIGQLLGFEAFIPPFTAANGSEILKGVNYASGSAGILDETGKQLGANIALSQQLQNHQVTISRIEKFLGSKDATTKHINQCLYLMAIGSNDYLNNYYVPKFFNSSKQYTPEQYAKVLIQQYSKHITALYNSGARKVAINGLGSIGCTPHSAANYDANGSLCVDYMNEAVIIFNDGLKSLVDQLNKNLSDAKFLYLDNSVLPVSPRVDVKVTGCCKVNDVGQCVPFERPCSKRTLYWDSFHPTESVNLHTAPETYLKLKKIL